MIFLQPFALWFAAAAPVVVALYLLKVRRRDAPVSTLLFWQRIAGEQRQRVLFRRLRNLLSLLLQLLILALLLLALARPELPGFATRGSSTVVILDRSLSLQTREANGRSRFDEACELAAVFARRANGHHELMLLAADAEPIVLSPFSPDTKALGDALAKVSPIDAAGNLPAAIERARALLGARAGERRIVTITDRIPTNGRNSEPAVEFHLVDQPHPNLAITRLSVRPLPNDPQTFEALVEVANFDDAPRSTNLELSLEGQLYDVKPLQLAPGETKTQSYRALAPPPVANARGWLAARLDSRDALAADDRAFAVLPPSAPLRVLLVSKGNFFLEKMLAANPAIRFELLTPEHFDVSFGTQFDAVLLDHFLPPSFTPGTLPAGNWMFLGATPWRVPGAEIERPAVTDAADPILRLVNLRTANLLRAQKQALPKPDDGWRWAAPLRSIDDPLLVAGERTRGSHTQRVIGISFDFLESDVPIRIAFPLLMSNAIAWLAGHSAEENTSWRCGETILLAPDESVWSKPQTEFAAVPTSVPEDEWVRGAFVPQRNGFYLRRRGREFSWIAVNTSAPLASDLRASGATPAAPSMSAHRPVVSVLTSYPLWMPLALGAFMLLIAEWWLFHRRRTE